MKKLFSLVLTLCMLLSAAALAEAPAGVQNMQPPKVVPTTNEQGETILGRIFDKDGNLVLEIKDDGTLVMTDVHHRENIESAEAMARLVKAYNAVMDNVHHSDVTCLLHDHGDLKVCINDVLASMNKDLDSHDLVMREMFDMNLPESITALLGDGAMLELTLEVEENQSNPLIAIFTTTGGEWEVLPTENVGDRQFKVRLNADGTMALMSDGHEVFNMGEESLLNGENIFGSTEGDDQSGNFTPSVSGKDAPTFKTFVDENGEVCIGVIRGAEGEGEDEMNVPNRNYIILTAVAGRRHNADIQTFEHLNWAYNSILKAEHVGQLFTEHDPSNTLSDQDHTTIAAMLDEALAAKGMELSHDQLVVKDLFEVTAYGDYLHALYGEDNYLEMTLNANLDPNKPVIVIHSTDSIHWHVHPIDESQLNEDGSITLKLYDLGVVAFLVEAPETIDAANAVQSPN